MKKILLASAASVAFAGAASAEVSWGFSGSMDFGYWDSEIQIDGSADLDADAQITDSLSANLNVQISITDGDFSISASEGEITLTITQDAGAVGGYLKFGDLDDGGASELFYADRSGMYHDMDNMDGNDDVVLVLEVDSFSLAAGCSELSTDCSGDWVFGAGADVGGISVGFGYEQSVGYGDSMWGISVDTEVGAVSLGASYIAESDGDNSIGIEGSADVSDNITVGGFYAMNECSSGWAASWECEDMWGVSGTFSGGATSVTVAYESEADGSENVLNIDGSMDIDDNTVIKAGYQKVVDWAGSDDGFYAGVEYTVNDYFSVVGSYSQLSSGSGDPEYNNGFSVIGTVTFGM